MTGWFETTIVDIGRLPLFLCFLAFIITFVVTRVITRLIRAGTGPFGDNVSASGVHVHHAVPGVVLLAGPASTAARRGRSGPVAVRQLSTIGGEHAVEP